MTVDTSNPNNLALNRMPEAERNAILAAWLRGDELQEMVAGEWVPATSLSPIDIVRVKPQPKTVVRWHNVFSDEIGHGCKNRETADSYILPKSDRTHVLKVTRTEGQEPTAEFIPV